MFCECKASRFCTDCKCDVDRCFACDNPDSSVCGAYIIQHKCVLGEYSGWYAGAMWLITNDEIDDLPDKRY